MNPLAYIQLSDDQVGEFMKIYKDEFREDLSIEVAREVAINLLKLYLLLSQLPRSNTTDVLNLTPPDDERSADRRSIGFRA